MPLVKPLALRYVRFMGQHLKKPVSLRLDDEQMARLERLAKKHGGKSGAINAGLIALEKGAPEPTPDQALRVLERLVKGRAR